MYKILFIPVLLLLLFSSCSVFKGVSTVNQSKAATTDTISDEKMFEFKFYFLEANRIMLQGGYDEAEAIFQKCLKINPSSATVYYQLANIYISKKDYKTALTYAEKSVQYNSDNKWYLFLTANLYGQDGQFDKSIELFKRLTELYPSDIEYHFSLADSYIQAGKIKSAIEVYNNIEANFGISEIVSLQKYKLYLSLNDKKSALNELTKLSKSDPSNVNYMHNIADYYYRTHQYNKAIEQYNEILVKFPDDGISHLGLADCYRILKEYDKSFTELKQAFESDNVDSDSKVQMLVSILQMSENNDKIKSYAYDLTEILVKKYPDNPDVNTIYANFKLELDQYKEARELLLKVVAVSKDKYQVWQQLIFLDNQFLDWESMYSHSSEALKYFPNQGMLYFFNGFSAFQLKKYEEAVKSLELGSKIIVKSDPVYLDMLTFLGESYYSLGEKSKAYEIFDNILSIDPQNVGVLNNYAYYLSLDNTNLDKAEKMSKITIEQEPESSTYLDTYAWILFQQKKYKEALKYITMAVNYNKEPSDVILEHYGDILFFNDKKDEAYIQWSRALEIGEGSSKLNEKVDKRTYIK